MSTSRSTGRSAQIERIQSRLGRRQLIWFGTRGEDAEALCDVEQFSASFSLIAPLRSRATVEAVALEELSGCRPDLDTYDIDENLRDHRVAQLRELMLTILSRPSALVTYRPSAFLSSLGFSRIDRCIFLGMFKGHQDAFEHKPWVESAIANLGIPVIPWRYVPNIELLDTRRLLDQGPVMLRKSRTTGGVGLTRVTDLATLERRWFDEDEAYVSVAPFIDDAVSLNVGAVVWDEKVTVHHASVQLIGIPTCTSRPFGYCGNDFAAAAALDTAVLDDVDRAAHRIGMWLRSYGYRGAFGVDFLLKDDQVMFTEINPRFQGSTHASCRLSVEAGQSCLVTDHLASLLGLNAPADLPLVERMREGSNLAHIVMHNTSSSAQCFEPGPVAERFRGLLSFVKADVLTTSALEVASGGILGRFTLRSQITETGHTLLPDFAAVLRDSGVTSPGSR